MKKNVAIIFLILVFTIVKAQPSDVVSEFPDPPGLPNAEYAVYTYDINLMTDILSYHYHDLWDIDNDGVKDVVSFVGNGGAHAYYHFQIHLSSSDSWYVYPTFQVEMPYYSEKEAGEVLGTLFPQFAVFDFDNDGVDEVYLNLDNPFGSIPKELIIKGVTSKRILIAYENEALIVRNFKE